MDWDFLFNLCCKCIWSVLLSKIAWILKIHRYLSIELWKHGRSWTNKLPDHFRSLCSFENGYILKNFCSFTKIKVFGQKFQPKTLNFCIQCQKESKKDICHQILHLYVSISMRNLNACHRTNFSNTLFLPHRIYQFSFRLLFSNNVCYLFSHRS